jgi:hypothetical protein
VVGRALHGGGAVVNWFLIFGIGILVVVFLLHLGEGLGK